MAEVSREAQPRRSRQSLGGLTRLRMRPDCHWLSRRREARPVPQGTSCENAASQTHAFESAFRSTRPVKITAKARGAYGTRPRNQNRAGSLPYRERRRDWTLQKVAVLHLGLLIRRPVPAPSVAACLL